MNLNRILLVDDSPRDTELALNALAQRKVTSSREERDVLESYQLGSNAYIVKPLDFEQFTNAVAQVGVFWAVLNEPPPEAATSERGSGSR